MKKKFFRETRRQSVTISKAEKPFDI
jgi:hypothetical protein